MPDAKPRRVLVFGSTGQLGRELARAEWPEGIATTFLDRQAADFMQPQRLAEAVRRHAPDATIIAAAYTNVDGAECDEDTATAVNAVAPGAIASAAAELSIPVVHISTDYVFDGRKGAPYEETDEPAPINAYGRSKLAGEREVRLANPRHMILRSSWVYSAFGKNFLRTMLRLAETREEVSVVADQLGCPTAACDLAAATARLLPHLLGSGSPWGTYHLAGGSGTSWFGFAEAIFAGLAALGGKRPRLEAISTSAYPTKADRPPDSRLSSAAFTRAFGFGIPGFEQALPAVLREAMLKAPEAAREAV